MLPKTIFPTTFRQKLAYYTIQRLFETVMEATPFAACLLIFHSARSLGCNWRQNKAAPVLGNLVEVSTPQLPSQKVKKIKALFTYFVAQYNKMRLAINRGAKFTQIARQDTPQTAIMQLFYTEPGSLVFHCFKMASSFSALPSNSSEALPNVTACPKEQFCVGYFGPQKIPHQFK